MILVNWGKYSDDINYLKIIDVDLKNVVDVVLKRLKILEAEGVPPDNVLMYGHSLGARLFIHVGIRFGKNRIGLIDGN